jgi:LCP family protein required for cell wall assembly
MSGPGGQDPVVEDPVAGGAAGGGAGVRRVVALAVAVLLLAAGAAAAVDGLVVSGSWRSGYRSADPLVVLAVGSDQGPPYRPGNPAEGLADGIHLFVVDTAGHRMTVVDIPRDSAIGGTKVNAHLVAGGPERLAAEVAAWSGLPIDFWVMGSFQSLTAVVQTMGGVAVDVPQVMVDPYSGSDLQPLAFARNRRSLADGDIGRSRNQGRLMLAALGQLQASGAADVRRVVDVVGTLREHTASNIPVGEVLPLAMTAMAIPPDRIEQVTLSGPFGTIGTGSVIYPQPGDLFVRLGQGDIGPGP